MLKSLKKEGKVPQILGIHHSIKNKQTVPLLMPTQSLGIKK